MSALVKRKRKASITRRIFNVFNVIFMLLIVAVMVLPYIHIVAKSLNEANDTSKGGIVLLPRVFTWRNYEAVIMDDAFLRATIVSVLRVLAGTLCALVVQFMAAYAFTRKDLVGRGPLLMFLMIPMYFGGGLIPTYILFANTGFINNYLTYILPSCFSLYNMVIIRSYINTLPAGLTEAAKLDGASEMGILLRIVVPLSKPILATMALWSAVGLWSDWTTTMYYFTKKKMFTLQYVLVRILKEAEAIASLIKDALMRGEILEIGNQITPEAVQCAQIIVTTIPIVITYPFLQKYFIHGVTMGAVKD